MILDGLRYYLMLCVLGGSYHPFCFLSDHM
jgi:hypothetical protein